MYGICRTKIRLTTCGVYLKVNDTHGFSARTHPNERHATCTMEKTTRGELMRFKDGYYYPFLFQSRETLAVSPIQDLVDDIYIT
jgi:hypothetical protein